MPLLKNKYFRLYSICFCSICCKKSKRISSVKSRDVQQLFFVRKLMIICFDKFLKKEQIRCIGQNLAWCREHMYYCSDEFSLCIHLIRAPLGVFFSPIPLVLDICQTNWTVNAKLAVPFGPSILHPMCKCRFRVYHDLAARVTSCPGDFGAK